MKSLSQILAEKDSAGTYIPHCIINAGVEFEGAGRLFLSKDPFQPTPFLAWRLVKHIVGASVPSPQFSADEKPFVKFQFLEMILDADKMLITELSFDHRKRSRKAFGVKANGGFIGDATQFLEHGHKHLQHIDRSVQYRGRIFTRKAPPAFFHTVDCFNRKIVDISDNGRVFQAILKNILAIQDNAQIIPWHLIGTIIQLRKQM